MTPETKLNKTISYNGDHSSQIMKLKWLTPELYNLLNRQYKHSATKIDSIKYGYVQESSLL